MTQPDEIFTEQWPFHGNLYSKQETRTCINGNKGTYKEKNILEADFAVYLSKQKDRNTYLPRKCHPLV